MSDANAIIDRLHAVFVESLHIQVPAADTDLFETGLVDSLQLVELLLQLERQFGFRIAIQDIDLDNLRTLDRIARLVAANAGAGAADEPMARPSFRTTGQGAAEGQQSVLEHPPQSEKSGSERVKEGGDESRSGIWSAPALGGG